MKGKEAIEGTLQRLELRSGIQAGDKGVSAHSNERVENKDASLGGPPLVDFGWGNWSQWSNQWG